MPSRSLTSIAPLISNIGPYNEVADDYDAELSFQALKTSKILVIGAGGLGCEILKNLALTGFKQIEIIDMDTIDVSNLNRQFLFRAGDVGKSKSITAANFIRHRMNDEHLSIIGHNCRIQDKPTSYYQLFDLIVCGLDSVEARRWINATLVSMVDSELNNLIPLIDGGTEGFRGQSRVILPTITSCYECTLDMVTPKVTYPVCTIANTPRLPEHCIEWASLFEWPTKFPDKKFDSDNPEDVELMFQLSKERADIFNIPGVTKKLTLGVVKNIIPAIASTNAIIAASCCNEAFKLITNTNPILNNYMMYSGDDSIFTYTYEHVKKPNCLVCGNKSKILSISSSWTLQEMIDHLVQQPEFQLKVPSLSTSAHNLYLRKPASLEELTRPNLDKRVSDLVQFGEEIIITDEFLPISYRVLIKFTDQ